MAIRDKNTTPDVQNTQTAEPTSPAKQAPQVPMSKRVSSSDQVPPKLVKFKSRYAKHTLNIDGVPKIEFIPVSSRDADQGGVFETVNPRQIEALRESDDFKRGIIKEVK